MTIERCPRCGQELPDDAYLEPVNQMPGRHPAYKLRHPKPQRADGTWPRKCVAYVGPELLLTVAPRRAQESGAGVARAVPAQLTSVT